MASWQAHVTTWILKWTLKPKLARAETALHARKLMRPRAFAPPIGVRITPERIGEVPGEWVEASAAEVTMLYLHGGGYFACSAETHRPITTAFAKNGFRVFAPDYRLAPEFPFPAAIEDAVAVYRGLLEQGIPAAKIVVGGDSAGGGLTLALLLSLRAAGTALPAAAVLFSPWTDLASTGDSIRTNDKRCAMFRGARIAHGANYYLGSADARNPLASPLYANLAGLPPMIVHVGGDEVLLDDSTRLAERARAAGVRVELKIWPVVPHVWQIVPTMPEARQSLQEVSSFLMASVESGAKHVGV
ncbi:MAG: alpha/beta hydrolase [Bryobacteraceae bacterium]|jgi:epsilon-lactone hydrolase